MDWKLEGSARETESPGLQEQEVILEDTGEGGISESFRLLQIDVECEHQEGETVPTGSVVWCSFSNNFVFWITQEKCPKKTETLGKNSCSKEEQKKARKRKKKSQSCRKFRHLPPAQ